MTFLAYLQYSLSPFQMTCKKFSIIDDSEAVEFLNYKQPNLGNDLYAAYLSKVATLQEQDLVAHNFNPVSLKHSFLRGGNNYFKASPVVQNIDRKIQRALLTANTTKKTLISLLQKRYVAFEAQVQAFSKSDSFEDYKELNKKMFSDRFCSPEQSGGAVFWSSSRAQEARFEAFLKLGDFRGCSVLDMGCGFGDMYTFLKNRGVSISKYVGYDIVPEIIHVAREKHPGVIFEVKDISKERVNHKFDFVLGSGLFAISTERWKEYVFQVLADMLGLAKRGVAVNFLCSPNAVISSDLHYSSIIEVMEIVRLLQEKGKCTTYKFFENYIEDDFSLFLYK